MIKLFTSCASGPKSAGPVATGREPFAIAINPDGKAAYVANFEDQTISQYDIGPGGALTPTIPATAAVAGNPLALAVTPNGKDVYVTTNGGPVLQYSVGTDETLTAKNHPTVPTGNGPAEVAVSPDGKSAYVTDFVGDTVSQYNIGTDGALHPKTHATVATGHNPLGIAVSPDSQSVYVADRADGLIAEYAVSANGLVLKFPETRPAGLNPTELVVAPDGKHVYGIDRGGEALLEYSGGDGPGPLTPLNPLSLPFNPPADLPGIAIGPPQIQFSCGGVLEFCRIRLVPLTSTGGTTTAVTFTGTVVRTAPLGILVQRIVGKRHVLVGHVPFGLHKTGRLRIRWNLRVNGHKLSQGRYLITLRMFDVEGHLIALAHPGKVTVK